MRSIFLSVWPEWDPAEEEPIPAQDSGAKTGWEEAIWFALAALMAAAGTLYALSVWLSYHKR